MPSVALPRSQHMEHKKKLELSGVRIKSGVEFDVEIGTEIGI